MEAGSLKRVYLNICIFFIWLILIYSSIIQQKFFKIPNAMLILGIGAVVFFVLGISEEAVLIQDLFPKECYWMICYMLYMLLMGTLMAPNKSNHLIQWSTCFEYMLIMMMISSLIKDTGTNTFHSLLLFIALALAVVFLLDPVKRGSGRYAISETINVNGMGLSLASGIWAILYYQKTRKRFLIITSILVMLFGYCLLQTGSRKSLISAGMIIILWLVFCYLPIMKESGVGNFLVGLIVIGILLYIIGNLFIDIYSDSAMAFRMGYLEKEATEGTRNEMYQQGWRLIKQNPIFGIGFRGFQFYFGSYSHATLVEIPVSGGLVGTLLYFGMYISSLLKCFSLFWKTRNNDKLIEENRMVRMVIVLWCVMLFYSTCLIHQYQFDSFILFGIIFGQSSYIEKRISVVEEESLALSNAAIYE